MRVLRYFLEEAWASLWRGRGATVLALLTITAALFVVGAFLVATTNIQGVVVRWSESAEISVYLKDDLAPSDRAVIDQLLARSAVVRSTEYVSKRAALDRFNHDFADLAPVLTDLGTNPFPASLEVRLRGGQAAADEVDQLARQLKAAPGISDVRYDRRWLERLMTAIGAVRLIGFGLGGVLIFAAALTVANVIRLALYARADEIEIMRLVGAPIAYIQGPFVVEGILQGGIGALIALGALRLVYDLLLRRYLVAAGLLMSRDAIQFLRAADCVALVAGGMLLGCVGGLVAAHDEPRLAG